jgi:creatine kinase
LGITSVKEGPLGKKAKASMFGGNRYQERYFVAGGGYLRYWNSKGDYDVSTEETLKAAIKLNSVNIEDSDKTGSFKLVSKAGKHDDDYVLRTMDKSQTAAQEWVTTLRMLQDDTAEVSPLTLSQTARKKSIENLAFAKAGGPRKSTKKAESPASIAAPESTPVTRDASYSVASNKTLDTLGTCKNELSAFRSRLFIALELLAGPYTAGEVIDPFKAAKSDVTQLSGLLEKFQFTRIDAIMTSELNSGKTVAKAQRKALNAAAEKMGEHIKTVVSFIDRRIRCDGTVVADATALMAKFKAENQEIDQKLSSGTGAAVDGASLEEKKAEIARLRVVLAASEQSSKLDKANFPTNFREKGQSLSNKLLTKEIYEKYCNVVGPRGYTFDQAIQCGLDGRSGTGMAIPDEESYYLWQDWYDLLIDKCHDHPAGTKHVTDLDYTKINTSKLPEDLDKYCISTRIRAARNIKGYGLPPGTSRSERREVESIIKEGLMGLDGELKGSYYGLYDMTPEQEKQLQDDHFLFQKPDPNAMIFSCGGVRDWPDARGIYHNDDKSFLVWVNEEDQMRVISMQKGGNVAEVFERWAKGVNEVEMCLQGKGKEYMYDDHLGQFSSCVSNVGTGLRASMHVLLPKLIEQIGQEALEKLCWDKLEMQCRGTGGEHTAAIGGRVDLSNQKRIGTSEVELVQIMIDGVCKLIELEKKAEVGDIKGEVEAMFGQAQSGTPKVNALLEELAEVEAINKKLGGTATAGATGALTAEERSRIDAYLGGKPKADAERRRYWQMGVSAPVAESQITPKEDAQRRRAWQMETGGIDKSPKADAERRRYWQMGASTPVAESQRSPKENAQRRRAWQMNKGPKENADCRRYWQMVGGGATSAVDPKVDAERRRNWQMGASAPVVESQTTPKEDAERRRSWQIFSSPTAVGSSDPKVDAERRRYWQM